MNMTTMPHRAARAYQAANAHRSTRQQEADVFRHAIGALRAAQAGTSAVARAVADNTRLWHTVMDLLRDPTNRLPDPIRANLLSIGHAVQREMRGADPDLGFLIEVNEQIASGLAT